MASLNQPGTDHVGFSARESLTNYLDSSTRPIGPFTTPNYFTLTYIRWALDLTMRGRFCATRSTDASVIYHFLLDSAQRIFSRHNHDDRRFDSRHTDDKGDHILVDDVYNATGIIDWAWARTKPVAFISSVLLLPVDTMKCAKEGCNKWAESGSRYCADHKP
ncbi:hypothetical protein BDW59DRAFT_153117 [Aspergillus cavernicola]|uniref:Aminoglycoside phosphotransferase domain-containing protein n=1 Tax=Aspergillus cavernicola TaxID=176166 RepID=A0ABR4HMC9_9EURO